MKRIDKMCMRIVFILIAIFFWQMFLRYYEKNDKEMNYLSNTFVFLTTNMNLQYRFLIPITVKFWQQLGVRSIVVIITDSDTDINESDETFKLLNELKAIIKIYKSQKLSPTSMSQIIRLFGAVLPSFNEMFSNDTILITSDADLAPFKLLNHIPDTKHGKTIKIHNTHCCDSSLTMPFIRVPPMRGNFTVPVYFMGTISATVKTWKQIMKYYKSAMTVDEIEEYIIQEFGDTFFNSSAFYSPALLVSDMWYADQSLISYKIYEWLKTKESGGKLTHQIVEFSRRIDRSAWPTAEQFARINFNDYDDCHQLNESYTSEQWERYKPFLKSAFKQHPELLERFTEYRDKFILQN